MSETTEIVHPFLEAASDVGHRMWRNNTGTLKAKGGFVAFGVGGVGSPDVMGPCSDGVFGAVELKLPGEKPSLDQCKWLLAVHRSIPLARIGWADNIADGLAVLAGIRKLDIPWLEARRDHLAALELAKKKRKLQPK